MLRFSSNMPSTMLLLLFSFFAFLHAVSGARQPSGQPQPVGVCYGTYANDQPRANEAITLAKSVGIQRIRLYGPDHNALPALRNTGIEVVLGVPNEDLQSLAADQDNANQWIYGNINNYEAVNFRYIVVGNGITPAHEQNSQYAQFVLPAMQNIQAALSAAGQQNRIRVSTAVDQSEILSKSFPPSQGEFRPEVRQFIDPIVRFLVKSNNTPLLVNFHPYFSYIYNKGDVPLQINQGKGPQDARLDYAVLRSSRVLVQDGRLGYTNVFDAMVDSVYSALEKAGGSSLDAVVSETGWPTALGPAASNENAAAHNNNVINHVRNSGTPKRPQKRIETYIYNMFNEKLKSEGILRHWGIFWNDETAKYPINFGK